MTQIIDKSTGEIIDRITFSSWLAGFNGGALDDELSAALDEVAEAVLLQGKAGSLTLTLAMKDDGGGLVVTADVNGKPPRSKRSAFFYRDGRRRGLTRKDPQQPQMPGMETED